MSEDEVAGRVALITGGAGGIGQALAKIFVAHGLRVGICDVASDAAERLADSLGPERAIGIGVDVADPAACARAVDQVADKFGALHVLVNNAGLGMGLVKPDHMERTVQIEDVSVELWQ